MIRPRAWMSVVLPKMAFRLAHASSAGSTAVEASLVDAWSRTRNFTIVGHVDHGKSTLCDRLLERTTQLVNVSKRLLGRSQVTDSLEVERARGITVKLQTVRMRYNGYTLNFIDTPGHVDFAYEVSRSLAACEGAVLLVDASQGVQAQTVANARLAAAAGLRIVPVLNKIDLPTANVPRCLQEMQQVLGLDPRQVLQASAKTGQGVHDILRAIVERVPAPALTMAAEADMPADPNRLRALVFDAEHDRYRGVIVLVRIFSGHQRTEPLRSGHRIQIFSTGKVYTVEEAGYVAPGPIRVPAPAGLYPGDVGYIIATIRSLEEVPVGDTITLAGAAAARHPLTGYRPAKPAVYAGLFPDGGTSYEELRDALYKLRLGDSALQLEPERSSALGTGFRVGFLGFLHMTIVRERLAHEHGVRPYVTSPSVVYRWPGREGDAAKVDSAHQVPPGLSQLLEPWVRLEVIAPTEYVGACMELLQSRRAQLREHRTQLQGADSDTAPADAPASTTRLEYDLPLAELVSGDLFDRLRASSRGYALLDYRPLADDEAPYRQGQGARIDFAVADEPVDGLSLLMCHGPDTHTRAKSIVQRLAAVIPRQLFKFNVQALIGSRVIASEHIPAIRKNVTAKCYGGGDVSRKRRLLDKQKHGRKQLRDTARVRIPTEAYIAALRTV